MPFDLQTRLLRVLSDGQFYRVGGHNPMRSNVRVIAATHQNLEDRVKQGVFREDLFHRLNVIRLRLPALRERQEDVPSLARFFLQKSAKELGVEAKRITDASLSQMMRFDFPGNVRQLENICHWLTVMAPAQTIEPKDLPPELQSIVSAAVSPAAPIVASGAPAAVSAPLPPAAVVEPVVTAVTASPPISLDLPGELLSTAQVAAVPSRWLADLERESRSLLLAGEPEVWDTLTRKFEAQLIHTALDLTRGRRIEAAQKLGIGRNTITRKIQELGLDD
jgi:two-component system nitrogen regulation response regulator GlnG